jgi:hypothetical protein
VILRGLRYFECRGLRFFGFQPTVEEQYKPDRAVLTLAFAKKQAASGKGKTIANKDMIVAFVTHKGEAKTADIADAVRLSQPRVRELLSELITVI